MAATNAMCGERLLTPVTRCAAGDDPIVETRRASIGRSRALVVVIGATTLAGQVCWSRLAAAVVGGTFASGAITLSAAMAGLAAGAFLAGAAVNRLSAGMLLRGTVIACGATLAAVPWLILQIGRAEGLPMLRHLLAASLLGLAHIPSGAIVPSVIAWRGVPKDRLASEGGALYALGALGAVIGALGVGEVLAARLALDQIGVLLGFVTLLSGGLLLVPSSGGIQRVGSQPPNSSRSGQAPRRLAAIAFGIGLLGLATESLWLRVLGFYWESNTLTYALVTASVVGGLSLGSLTASRIAFRWRPGRGAVAVGLGLSAVALAGAAALAPSAAHALTPCERVAMAFLLVGVPAVFFGGTFVLLLACVKGEGNAGRALGLLSGANSAGSAAGPLILWASSAWISWPAQLLFLMAAGYAALIVAVVGLRSRGAWTALLLTAALTVCGWGLAPSAPSPADYNPFGGPSTVSDFDATVFPFVRSGLASTVVVSRNTRSGVDVLWIDRGCQGDTSPLGRHIPSLLGRFPCELLSRTPRRAMVIGLGTGITLSGVVQGGAQAVEVAELSRGVIEANRTILGEVNGRVLERSEVLVHHEDGRTRLVDAAAPYDLIIADMIFPSVIGASNLFSREFYALARRRLTSDGLFVQWLPCFQLSPQDVSAVSAAFLESFPEGTAWIGFLAPRRFILGLAGGALPRPLPEAAAARLALGPSELKELAAGQPPIRDADPRLEYRSNKAGVDASWGRENLHRVLERMRTLEPREDWIPRESRFRWDRSRRAWWLFAEAGLAELRADEELPGSPARRDSRERADALYREAVATGPGATDAEFLIRNLAYERELESAQTAYARRDASALLASLERAASHPLHGMGNLHLADALAAQGRFEEAIAELEKAVAKSPRSADAHLKLALLAYNAGDYEKARKAFEAAAALRPDRPPSYREIPRPVGGGGG